MSPTTETPYHHPWLRLSLYCTLALLGGVGAPLLQKLYYAQGGSLKWFQSGLQSVGIVILLPQILFLYLKTTLPPKLLFLELKLLYWSLCIGLLLGLTNYLSSAGLSRLPVSTYTLLTSTQLVFTAFFALIIVRHRFTWYSSGAVVAITLGAAVLGLDSSGDTPGGVTRAMYLVGFLLVLCSAALAGLCAPLYQLAFGTSNRSVDYLIMMQFVVVVNLASAVFSVVGMLINSEFQAIPGEAKKFSLGKEVYCLIIVASAILWQLTILGTTGIIRCKSSLFASIYASCLIPITQVASIITFHEKFAIDKGLSLALCLLGFIFYFIGEYKMTQRVECSSEDTLEDSLIVDRKQ